MFRVAMVLFFGMLAVAVAAGVGDFAWISRQVSEVMFWVAPSLTAAGALVGLFRRRRI